MSTTVNLHCQVNRVICRERVCKTLEMTLCQRELGMAEPVPRSKTRRGLSFSGAVPTSPSRVQNMEREVVELTTTTEDKVTSLSPASATKRLQDDHVWHASPCPRQLSRSPAFPRHHGILQRQRQTQSRCWVNRCRARRFTSGSEQFPNAQSQYLQKSSSIFILKQDDLRAPYLP